MAGFDFSVRKDSIGEPSQRGLLRWVQRQARDLGLTFRYATHGGSLRGVLDGPLIQMQVLGAYLPDDFYAFAAAYPRPTDGRRRKQIAADLLCAFEEGLAEITQDVREASELFGGAPNSLVFQHGTSETHLHHPLRSLTRTQVLARQGRISDRTVLEETHTVLQLLLRDTVGRGLSFSEMVGVAANRKILTSDQAETAIALSRVRRDSKHRGQGVSGERLGPLLRDARTIIHRLLANLQT